MRPCCLGQNIGQRAHLAGARPEALAVVAEDQAEADVRDPRARLPLRRQDARLARRAEDQPEVARLGTIRLSCQNWQSV